MAKAAITLAVILGFAIIGSVIYTLYVRPQSNIPGSQTGQTVPEVTKPPIVDHFACSDYCPGPEEQYTKKVYEGINNELDCEKVGGTPYTYTGWGTVTICLAE